MARPTQAQRIAAYRQARSRRRVLWAGASVLGLAILLMFVPPLLWATDILPNSALSLAGPLGLSLPAIAGLVVVLGVQLDQPGLAWAAAGVLAGGSLLAWPIMGLFTPLGIALLLLMAQWHKARPRPPAPPPPAPHWQVVG